MASDSLAYRSIPSPSSNTSGEFRLGQHKVMLATVAIFVISCVVRIALSLFDKHVAVYPDEYYYLDIARSLFANGTVTVRGVSTAFQNYLCSITMMPAMIFSDTYTQIQAIGVLNSIYVSTSVFPAMMFGRRILHDDRLVIAGAAFTAILPDLVYSITFMSEAIYMPLGMWTLLLLWETIEADGLDNHIVLGAASGVMLYLLYFAKAVGLYMGVAFVVASIVHAASDRKHWREQLAAVLACMGAFLIIYVALKLTVFTSPSTYSSTNGAFSDSGRTAYLGFAFVCNLLFALIGLFYFPIIYPALTFDSMDRERKDLYILCLSALITGVAVVSYMISVKEAYGDVVTRQHLRYYAPLVAPFAILFMAQLAEGKKAQNRDSRSAVLIATANAGICLLICFYIDRISWTAVIDSTMLQYFNVVCDAFQSVLQKLVWTEADLGLIAMKVVIVAIACVGTLLLFTKSPKRCGVAIFAGMVALCAANNVLSMKAFKSEYATTKESIDETVQISDYIAQTGGNVLVILDDTILDSIPTRMEETYLTCPNRYQVYWQSIRLLESGDGFIDLDNDTLFITNLSRAGSKDYPTTDHIDYIVMSPAISGVQLSPGSYKVIGRYENANLILYQNLDTSKVHVIVPEQ